jgi:hypothetical protein
MDRKWVMVLIGTGLIILSLLALTFSGGCISRAIVQAAEDKPAVSVTPNVTLTPMPTETVFPAYTDSPADLKYRNHQYNLTEWLTWRRDDVSGLKDMIVHVTVYGYQEEPNFEEHLTSWGTDAWFEHVPNTGMKYMFVYVCMYMDPDNDPNHKDPRMWGMDASHYALQIGSQVYSPLTGEVDPKEPIKELENVWDIDHVHGIGPYGYSDLSISTANGNSRIYPDYYLRMGRSNKWDGWLLFEIPAKTRPEDIAVLGNFDHLGGNAYWSLLK